ncbi:30S ribosomal protein S5 [Roseimaritima multifibrata]|uniref:Small ribosomal subunit protein uS5 n=1 Tax=Roseimaritima multifibrata TaxID=1930274 RepID=A0A517MDH7_9BACT|nr:30S ribosomal protein S5 [Roseimaritima multifibrata]QDS92941.1 30S ribosomal protein S5 [Roseimaritima multifibrata]
MSQSNQPGELLDRVVKIKRCAAVVKGGRRFSFAAMVVVGDGKGRVGWGYGKANEVPPSVQKGQKQASRSLINVPVVEGSIPHQVWGRFGAAKVLLIPAGAGTGIIAGQAVRSVCEACGIHDILTKSYGTNNPVTLVKATIDALSKLRTRDEVAALRGLDPDELRGETSSAPVKAAAPVQSA